MTHDMLHMRGGHQVAWLIDGVEIPNTNIAIQPRRPDRPQGHRLPRSPARQLHRRRRRPHLRRLQRRPAHRLRARPPGRARPLRRQLPPDQRPAQPRRPQRAQRLLRQPQRQSQRLRPRPAHRRSPPRRHQRRRRLRVPPLQPHAEGPAPPHRPAPPRLLPGPLRPQLHRLRGPTVQLQRPARHPARVRRRRPLHLAAHPQSLHRPPALAALPLQHRRLRLQPQRHPRRHHRPSHLQLRRSAGLPHRHHRAQHPAGRPLLLRSARQLPVRRHLQRRQRHRTHQRTRLHQRRRGRRVRLRQLQAHRMAHPHRRPAPGPLPGPVHRGRTPTHASARPFAFPASTGSSAAFTAASTSLRRSLTASGPVLAYANANSTTLVPLHGERDEEHQFGLQIPFRGWLLDAGTFKTRVNNFLDHSNIGDSSIYFPITVDGALVRAWELTLRSPRIARLGQAHLAYSNQIAQQRGNITGGLICTPIGDPACDAGFSYTPVDHDQRNTLNLGFNATLPARAYASANVYYGSGFTNGSPDPTTPYPNAYLPAAHHLRPRLRQVHHRKHLRLHHRNQRRQPPRPARQLPHLRRLPLQRPPPALRRTPLPLPLLIARLTSVLHIDTLYMVRTVGPIDDNVLPPRRP